MDFPGNVEESKTGSGLPNGYSRRTDLLNSLQSLVFTGLQMPLVSYIYRDEPQ